MATKAERAGRNSKEHATTVAEHPLCPDFLHKNPQYCVLFDS